MGAGGSRQRTPHGDDISAWQDARTVLPAVPSCAFALGCCASSCCDDDDQKNCRRGSVSGVSDFRDGGGNEWSPIHWQLQRILPQRDIGACSATG